jgi:hypothetical protein
MKRHPEPKGDASMDNIAADQPLDKRRKEARPEHINVGDETFERNDITARRYGGSERTINRGDRDGAPFRYFNGVKYRPVKRYDAYVLNTIQEQKPQAAKRKRRK